MSKHKSSRQNTSMAQGFIVSPVELPLVSSTIALEPSLWVEVPFIDERKTDPTKRKVPPEISALPNEYFLNCCTGLVDFFLFNAFFSYLFEYVAFRVYRNASYNFYVVCTDADRGTMLAAITHAINTVEKTYGPLGSLTENFMVSSEVEKLLHQV